MSKLFLKVAPGRTVFDQDTGEKLGPEPFEVTDSTFWRRRLRDGDVQRVTPPAVDRSDKTAKSK